MWTKVKENHEKPCSFFDPANPKMSNEKERLQTFSPIDNFPNNPSELADAGFFYPGKILFKYSLFNRKRCFKKLWFLGKSGTVTCFYCNGQLKKWKSKHNAFEEHAMWFPT